MHQRLLNEVFIDLTLRPRTPLLIKAGGEGEAGIDPILPDMSFVRTLRAGAAEPEVYIPGSSLRGVLRGHVEKLLRSVGAEVCDPTHTQRGEGATQLACPEAKPALREKGADKASGAEAYRESCHGCRLFGNTALAGRVRVGDLYASLDPAPVGEVRYGVAIDRVTGAVAQGPFELETVTDGRFSGQIQARNITIGQLGLLAAGLLDLADGLLPMGYGKSRGLGRVSVHFDQLSFRTVSAPGPELLGAARLLGEERARYGLAGLAPAADVLAVGGEPRRERWYWAHTADHETATAWLEAACGRWVDEVGGQGA